MNLLNRGKKFTAVFAANDICAMGVKLALSEKSLSVPEDVSVIGFDDQCEAAFTVPPLTTVHQPAYEMGLAAASCDGGDDQQKALHAAGATRGKSPFEDRRARLKRPLNKLG